MNYQLRYGRPYRDLGRSGESSGTIDACLARVVPAILVRSGAVLITADHGNAELMVDATNQPWTAYNFPHSCLAHRVRERMSAEEGSFGRFSPTVLELLGLQARGDDRSP